MRPKFLLGLLVSGSLVLAACSNGPPKSPETDGVSVTAIVEGTGKSPTANDVVLINYKGTLPDGSVFDEAQEAMLPLEGIIPGFIQALLKMQSGGKYAVIIPSKLGYGADKVGPIPPNTDLHFEIELLAVMSRAEAEQKMQSQLFGGSKNFTPKESSSDLMTLAEKFQGCSLASGTLSGVFLNNDPQLSETLLLNTKLFHEIAIGYAVLSGLNYKSADEQLKNREYAESEMISQLTENINPDQNMELLISSQRECDNSIKNGKNDGTLKYIIKKFTS